MTLAERLAKKEQDGKTNAKLSKQNEIEQFRISRPQNVELVAATIINYIENYAHERTYDGGFFRGRIRCYQAIARFCPSDCFCIKAEEKYSSLPRNVIVELPEGRYVRPFAKEVIARMAKDGCICTNKVFSPETNRGRAYFDVYFEVRV